jgi:hypothetical protein
LEVGPSTKVESSSTESAFFFWGWGWWCGVEGVRRCEVAVRGFLRQFLKAWCHTHVLCSSWAETSGTCCCTKTKTCGSGACGFTKRRCANCCVPEWVGCTCCLERGSLLTRWNEIGCGSCAETVASEGEAIFAEGERAVGESYCSTRSRSWVSLLLGFLSSFIVVSPNGLVVLAASNVVPC